MLTNLYVSSFQFRIFPFHPIANLPFNLSIPNKSPSNLPFTLHISYLFYKNVKYVHLADAGAKDGADQGVTMLMPGEMIPVYIITTSEGNWLNRLIIQVDLRMNG
jgi:hypothetical protein